MSRWFGVGRSDLAASYEAGAEAARAALAGADPKLLLVFAAITHDLAALQAGDRPYQVLLLLTDGLIRDQEEILRGCYSIVGAQVPLFGGAAADGWRMTGTYLMADGKVLHDAVVAATIASDAPLSVSVRHGFHLVGPAMFVTSGTNGRVRTLD